MTPVRPTPVNATPRQASRSERHSWLLQYFVDQRDSFDVLNRDFVDAYAEATNAKVAVMMFGANKCPQQGNDLSDLARHGLLTRHAAGLQGMGGMGFPRWVYSYSLTDAGRKQALLNSRPAQAIDRLSEKPFEN